jgi:hypothetical protein
MLDAICTNKRRKSPIAVAALAVIVFLAGGRTSAAVDLFVDFGVADVDTFTSSSPNQVQAGYSDFSVDPTVNGTPVSDLALGVPSASRNFSGVTVSVQGGGNGMVFHDLVTEVNHALGDLIEDGVSVPDADLTITVSGLPPGTYTWTGFHHTAADGGTLPFDIYVNTGLGESLAAADVDASFGFNPVSVTTSEFSFMATGADVVVRLDGEFGDPITSPFLNGFSMVQVPEPASGLLLALAMIPLLAWRVGRRSGRRTT